MINLHCQSLLKHLFLQTQIYWYLVLELSYEQASKGTQDLIFQAFFSSLYLTRVFFQEVYQLHHPKVALVLNMSILNQIISVENLQIIVLVLLIQHIILQFSVFLVYFHVKLILLVFLIFLAQLLAIYFLIIIVHCYPFIH